jgi:tetratricopeptide (TPR) repeat protein
MTTTNRLRLIVPVCAAWLLLCGFSLPGAFERVCAAGSRLFHRGDFAAAERQYEGALKDHPDDPTANFGYGAALYRDGKYQEALDAYGKAAKATDPALQESAEYNAGNAAFRLKQADKALEHYKRSLYLQSSDQDAKHNLELALKQQNQQDNQKNQDKNDKQKPPQSKPKAEPQPQPKQDQLSKQEAERLLKSTTGDDEKLQKDLRRSPTSDKPTQGKDW